MVTPEELVGKRVRIGADVGTVVSIRYTDGDGRVGSPVCVIRWDEFSVAGIVLASVVATLPDERGQKL